MKTYKSTITLIKNNRGCYILDTIKGCSICLKDKPNGCYNDCYAKNISKRYGFDFSKPVYRDFDKENNQLYLFDFMNTEHFDKIIHDIKNIDMPFIRIGEMGDPSENWEHTINICEKISIIKKPIVIITKHWKKLSKEHLKKISNLDICINTSISALDDDYEIEHRLNQYNILKKYCNSVLRIVSCNFNKDNIQGNIRHNIQEELFKNDKIINTVFRPNKNNPLILQKIINVKKIKFLKSKILASVYDDKSYLDMCDNCPDMCGINFNNINKYFININNK